MGEIVNVPNAKTPYKKEKSIIKRLGLDSDFSSN